MIFKNKLSTNVVLLAISLLIIFFFFKTINYFTHIHDGSHHGLIFSNGLDILKGKLPYKEIFVQYGLLHDLLNSITLFFLNNDIIAIYINTALFYFTSVIILGLISKEISNLYSLYLTIIVIIFNHPLPYLPWSNYLAFLFLSLSVYLFTLESEKKIFLSGFFLSLSILSRENFYYFILPSFLLINIYIFYYLKNLRLNFFFLFGFLLPLIFFFSYLLLNNIYLDWFNYQKLPFIYLDRYDSDFFQLLKNFLNYLFVESFFNIINKPQYILILTIIIFNIYSLFEQLIIQKKNLKIMFICITCLSSFVVALNLEIFRLYTSIIIGLPVVFYQILNKFNNDNKFISYFLLLFISSYSIFFYPQGNVKFYKNINFDNSYQSSNFKYFKYQQWESHHWELLDNIKNINNKVKNNCNIKYILNMTPNAFVLLISDFDRVQITPYFTEHLGTDFNYILHNDFKEKLYREIQKNNLFIYSMENNILILQDKMKNFSLYKSIKVKGLKGSKMRVYLPNKCINRL